MNCYIYNPYIKADLPKDLNKDNTLFYPESGMTTHQLATTGRPRDYHIVTDSHFLVPLYKRSEVFILKGNEWVNPDFNTYATSYSIILSSLWDLDNSIPQAVIDGKITNVMGRKL